MWSVDVYLWRSWQNAPWSSWRNHAVSRSPSSCPWRWLQTSYFYILEVDQILYLGRLNSSVCLLFSNLAGSAVCPAKVFLRRLPCFAILQVRPLVLLHFIMNLTKNTTKTNFLLTFRSLSETFIRWSWYSELPVLDTLRKLHVKKTVVAVAEGEAPLISVVNFCRLCGCPSHGSSAPPPRILLVPRSQIRLRYCIAAPGVARRGAELLL